MPSPHLYMLLYHTKSTGIPDRRFGGGISPAAQEHDRNRLVGTGLADAPQATHHQSQCRGRPPGRPVSACLQALRARIRPLAPNLALPLGELAAQLTERVNRLSLCGELSAVPTERGNIRSHHAPTLHGARFACKYNAGRLCHGSSRTPTPTAAPSPPHP